VAKVDRTSVFRAAGHVRFPYNIDRERAPDVKHKRYIEERIISILKEHEAGASVLDISWNLISGSDSIRNS